MQVFIVVQISKEGHVLGLDVFDTQNKMHTFMDEVERANNKDLWHMYWYKKEVQ